MKAEHPSTALPQSARIHFGRAYEIEHDVPVRPLGLIHDASMEMLLKQFEGNVFKENGESIVEKKEGKHDEKGDKQVKPADMGVVKDMRQSIMDVLEGDISPYSHMPPREVV
jgi:hypothetical protein